MLMYWLLTIISIQFASYEARICGCKNVRPCYQDMINALRSNDETQCIEDATIAMSTIFVYLKAVREYCPEVIVYNNDQLTNEGKVLYEVMATSVRAGQEDKEDQKPVIIIDAGMEAGTESVGLALHVLEQLVACMENVQLLERIRWIILPAVNPDGMEFARSQNSAWTKNLRPMEDGLSYGVDVSRNFDAQWSKCGCVDTAFSPVYPGPSAASENETIFVQNVLQKYKKEIKAYLSLRRNGHSISYPYAYTKNSPNNNDKIVNAAGDIASKVNQRASIVQQFTNDTIYGTYGKERCGHSVDYAQELGVPMAFEMRVFLGTANQMISNFQNLPRGYERSLRSGYFNGIKELYNTVIGSIPAHC